jgi:hypothetical protein
MNTEIKLTIGIPSIPERMTGNFLTLFNKISKQWTTKDNYYRTNSLTMS